MLHEWERRQKTTHAVPCILALTDVATDETVTAHRECEFAMAGRGDHHTTAYTSMSTGMKWPSSSVVPVKVAGPIPTVSAYTP